MLQVWQVNVRDSDGNAVTDARVTMKPAAELEGAGLTYPFAGVESTHAHEAGGRYVSTELEPAPGPWLLIVQNKDKSPIVQHLEMRENARGELFTNTPLGSLAKTVTFAVETVATPDGKQRTTRFTATLFPASEIVLFSGTEYHSAGTQFHLFALGRRAVLFREKKLVDDGTLVTLISCDHRAIATFVKAHRGFVAPRALPAPPHKPGRAHVKIIDGEHNAAYGARLESEGVMSITALYRYLSEVGQLRPGTVKEASLFSHSWAGGPILYNSFRVLRDASTDAPPPAQPQRFELDFDARPEDFLTENVDGPNGWPHMKQAFTKDASFRTWGCNANSMYRQVFKDAKANEKKPESEPFVTVYTTRGKPRQRQERAINGKGALHGAYMAFAGPDVYLAAAAKFLGINTIGAAPGAGSEFRYERGIPFMRVVPGDWGATYPYLEKHFKPDFAPSKDPFDQGYVSYSKIAARAEPPRGNVGSAGYRFFLNLDVVEDESKGWVAFDSGQVVKLNDNKFVMKSEAASIDGKAGHRFVLKGPKRTLAFFAADSGEVFELRESKKGRFDVLGPEVVDEPAGH